MSSMALAIHLEQISACAGSIAELEFIGPGAFTNALLARPDITSLIRDIEVYEKSLFSLAPRSMSPKVDTQTLGAKRTSGQFATRTPRRRPTAVATVLGRDLHLKVANAKQINATSTRQVPGQTTKTRQGLDVEVLLEGAEKLCAVYPAVNARGRIARLRERHEQLAASIAHYEERVQANTARLEAMHENIGQPEPDEDVPVQLVSEEPVARVPIMSADELADEEREIRELEEKKRELEDRVSGIEKDLGMVTR